MHKLRPHLETILYLVELSLIALTGWLLRIVVVNKLPPTIKVGATVLDSRWITLPVSFALIFAVAWFLHKRLHSWLSTQEWWATGENG